MKEYVGSAVRHVLGLVSGGLLASGAATEDEISAIAGGITAVIVVAWSFYQKNKAKG